MALSLTVSLWEWKIVWILRDLFDKTIETSGNSGDNSNNNNENRHKTESMNMNYVNKNNIDKSQSTECVSQLWQSFDVIFCILWPKYTISYKKAMN